MYVRVSRQNIKTAIVNIFHMFKKVEESIHIRKKVMKKAYIKHVKMENEQ